MVEAVRQGMTLAEFIQRSEAEVPFEFIDGEVIPVSPNVAGHDLIARRLFVLLYTYATAQRLGEVFAEAAFALAGHPDWVTGSRKPDVLFYRAERFAEYIAATPDWRSKPFLLVPDLVVEVMSHTDRISAVLKKAALYLDDGVQTVWVIDQERQTVSIYTPHDQPNTLNADQILTHEPLLPGFSTIVRAIFEN